MNRRVNIHVAALLGVSAIGLAAPALVQAQSGGVAPSGSGGSGSSQPGAPVRPGTGTVTASGNGIVVVTHASAILRSPLRFSGNAGRRAAGATIEIERRGRQTGGLWAPTAHGIASSNGSFTATWPTNHIGRFAIRAVVERGRRARTAAASPSLTITVYRPSIATIYGPGFYGQRTACGKVLSRTTLGVAHRTLPCGTPVAILYGGRTIVVPVIDRGPYAHGADWDLTTATAKALGITSTVRIGAVSLPRTG